MQTPVIHACMLLEHKLSIAAAGPYSHAQANVVMSKLTSSTVCKELNAIGLDIVSVPAASDHSAVMLHILRAEENKDKITYRANAPTSIILGNIHFIPVDYSTGWAAINRAMLNAFNVIGAEAWTKLHIMNAANPVKVRARRSCGIFLARGGDALVAEAAHTEQMPLSDIQYEQVERAKANIADARALLYAAIEAKDAEIAVKAQRYATCYAEDMAAEVSHCIALRAHLTNLAYARLPAMGTSVVLVSVHAALQKRLDALPLPKVRELATPWRVVKRISLDDKQALKDALQWVREA